MNLAHLYILRQRRNCRNPLFSGISEVIGQMNGNSEIALFSMLFFRCKSLLHKAMRENNIAVTAERQNYGNHGNCRAAAVGQGAYIYIRAVVPSLAAVAGGDEGMKNN